MRSVRNIAPALDERQSFKQIDAGNARHTHHHGKRGHDLDDALARAKGHGNVLRIIICEISKIESESDCGLAFFTILLIKRCSFPFNTN